MGRPRALGYANRCDAGTPAGARSPSPGRVNRSEPERRGMTTRLMHQLGRSPDFAGSRILEPFWHTLLWPDSRAAPRESSAWTYISRRQPQFPPDVLHHHETTDAHVQHVLGISTRSGFRRGCGRASCRPPSDLLDQIHVSGALSGACTGKVPQMANRRPAPKTEHFGTC